MLILAVITILMILKFNKAVHKGEWIGKSQNLRHKKNQLKKVILKGKSIIGIEEKQSEI